MNPSTERLVLSTVPDLREIQTAARRCMAAWAAAGHSADETCATWADRVQDEIGRREAGVQLPAPVTESLTARYGRTGPRGSEGL
jgi:hypothetical protein